jgi:hypothetical protein
MSVTLYVRDATPSRESAVSKHIFQCLATAFLVVVALIVSVESGSRAEAKAVTPASVASHHSVQPNGGCIGPLCGRVYNYSSYNIPVSDNWCDDNGGHGCGNIGVVWPNTWSPFSDTDALSVPFVQQGPCHDTVQFTQPGGSFTQDIYGWTKISDIQTAYVLSVTCG